MDRKAFDRKYSAQLNHQQNEAVHTVEGAVLLLAVPGSGKTTVLVTRLGYMLCCCGIPADRILTMTYTKAATREMKLRFSQLFREDCPQIPEFRTINGISSKIITYYTRTHGSGQAFTLMEDDGMLSRLVGDLYRELTGEFATRGITGDLRSAITYVKNMMLTADAIEDLDTGFEKFPELYRRYNLTLKQQRWMDYDDQMVYARRVLEQYPDVLNHFQEEFPYICVDESQDTSKIQHEIIRLLAQKTGNLFMVGDEDQSIYGFRAAYPEALTEFEKTYPHARVLLMEENYRSRPEILRPADLFIRKNRNRRPKTIRPTRAPGGEVSLISAVDRAAQYLWLVHAAAEDRGQTAILYRNNESALPLIDMLDRQGIPYRCKQMDDAFFTHRMVTDILNIISFAHDTKNAEVFLQIYYKLGGGISKKAAEYACEKAGTSGKSILEELLQFPQLSSYAGETVKELAEQLPLLLQDKAVYGLNRIWRRLRYGDYADRQKLDGGRFEILCLLAEQEDNLEGFISRLEELRGLVNRPAMDSGVILSTIHSSKGLEYHTVYLADVLDGILPPVVPEPGKAEKRRQYQEERRLFYVAMTRAKERLFLFSCLHRSASFADELKQTLPGEVPEEDDLLGGFSEELCGKHYYHRQMGRGTVVASCNGTCMIAYPGGEACVLTLGQMVDQRMIRKELPKKTAAPEKKPPKDRSPKKQKPIEKINALSPEEKKNLEKKATKGRKIVHRTFGLGSILSYKAPVVTIRFEDGEEKKFVLLDSIERGLLRYGKKTEKP